MNPYEIFPSNLRSQIIMNYVKSENISKNHHKQSRQHKIPFVVIGFKVMVSLRGKYESLKLSIFTIPFRIINIKAVSLQKLSWVDRKFPVSDVVINLIKLLCFV